MSELKQIYKAPGASKPGMTESREASSSVKGAANAGKSSTLAERQKRNILPNTSVGKRDTIANAIPLEDDLLYIALAMLDKLNKEHPGAVLKIADVEIDGTPCMVLALPRDRWQYDKTGTPSWKGSK